LLPGATVADVSSPNLAPVGQPAGASFVKRHAVLRMLQAAQGGVVSDRLLLRWSGTAASSLNVHITWLRIQGHTILRNRGVGYRLVRS